MDRLSNEFRTKAAEVERMQHMVKRRQHRLARITLRICCSVIIQTIWRGFRGRLIAHDCRRAILGGMLSRLWRRCVNAANAKA